MNVDDILSFSTPRATVARADVIVAPVLELAYCYYALNRNDIEKKRHELPWLDNILENHGELVDKIRLFWQEPGGKPGFDLFWMAGDLGYARDKTIDRFFEDLARLPAEFKVLVTGFRSNLEDCDDHEYREKHLKMYDGMLERLVKLEDHVHYSAFEQILRELWHALEPFWLKEGQYEAEKARQVFLEKFTATGDVLKALPAHHFIQFEGSAKAIRNSQQKGRLIVIPLYFSSSGGFNFDFEDVHYIGYGIQSEHLHERLAQQVDQLAGQLKAFADPTRLMLFTLIAKYEHFSLTVGDLSIQLGVSQPTVSGHLKLLREAELILLEKRGNKSFYKVDKAALAHVMSNFESLIQLHS